MKNAVFITVGTRDIQMSDAGREIAELNGIALRPAPHQAGAYCLSSPRQDGEKVLACYCDLSKLLLYPLIKPVLSKVAADIERIDAVVLFATDQGDAPEEFRRNDTCFLAQIIKRLIEQDFRSIVVKVWKVQLLRSDVIFHDAMFQWFGEKFSQEYAKSLPPGETSLHVFPQGGIDAVNTALLMRAIEYYPSVFHLSKPEGTHQALSLEFPAQLSRNLKKALIEQALRGCDYQTVVNAGYSEMVTGLSSYGSLMLSHQFKEAEKTARRLADMQGPFRTKLLHLADDAALVANVFSARLCDYYLNAKIKLLQGQYSDFLVRAFGLAENMLRPRLEEYLGGPIRYNKATRHREWLKLLENKPGLIERLKESVVQGGSLDYAEPGRAAYRAIFAFIKTEGVQDQLLDSIQDILETLCKLRNNVAHDLRQVSRGDIETALRRANKDHTLEKLVEYANQYFKIQGLASYDRLNQIIRETL